MTDYPLPRPDVDDVEAMAERSAFDAEELADWPREERAALADLLATPPEYRETA